MHEEEQPGKSKRRRLMHEEERPGKSKRRRLMHEEEQPGKSKRRRLMHEEEQPGKSKRRRLMHEEEQLGKSKRRRLMHVEEQPSKTKALDERNARQRANRQNISTKEREVLLAQRKANAAARQNTPCAKSIAMPCPNAAALATVNPT